MVLSSKCWLRVALLLPRRPSEWVSNELKERLTTTKGRKSAKASEADAFRRKREKRKSECKEQEAQAGVAPRKKNVQRKNEDGSGRWRDCNLQRWCTARAAVAPFSHACCWCKFFHQGLSMQVVVVKEHRFETGCHGDFLRTVPPLRDFFLHCPTAEPRLCRKRWNTRSNNSLCCDLTINISAGNTISIIFV